jgi:hypothetical protein
LIEDTLVAPRIKLNITFSLCWGNHDMEIDLKRTGRKNGVSAIRKVMLPKYLLWILFILCLLDTLFTDVGIRYQYIQEGNPMIRYLYEKEVLWFYMAKIGLPLALFVMIPFVKRKYFITKLLVICILLYLVVLLLHLKWLISLF